MGVPLSVLVLLFLVEDFCVVSKEDEKTGAKVSFWFARTETPICTYLCNICIL